MWAAIIQLGIILGTYIYHRTRNPAAPKIVDREVRLPRTEEGAIIPLIFGRCRIRTPVLAWLGNVQVSNGDGLTGAPTGNLCYRGDAFFTLGIPFENGHNRIHSIYVGESPLDSTLDWVPNVDGPPTDKRVRLVELVGDGGFEWDTRRSAVRGHVDIDTVMGPHAGGWVEFLNGNTSQNLFDPTTLTETTTVGERMAAAGLVPAETPGYRGFMSVFLFGYQSPDPDFGFDFGGSPQLPAVSFEASSYPFDSLVVDRIGLDANPADVIYHLLKDKFGKLGLPLALVDYETFRACAETLSEEGHGYSRAIEDGAEAQEIIDEILTQIDGLLYEDPSDGLIKLRLIRPDFNPATIRSIGPDNCERIEDFAAGGWTNIPNKIRVIFTDRYAGYVDGSATAQNQANAVGQDGLVRELVLRFPGVCTQALADSIASRELSARSRPIAKMRAIVDRFFWDSIEGDAVMVNWPQYNISGMVCRAAKVTRGPADSNTVTLDLIQDFFYVHRRIVNPSIEGEVAPFPGSGGLLLE